MSGFDGSVTTRSGSTSLALPRPSHSGQAPWGLLNENDRVSISEKRNDEFGLPSSSENSTTRRSSPSPASDPVDRVLEAKGRFFGRVGDDEFEHAAGLVQRGLDGVGDARARLWGDLHAVDDHVDGVVVVLVEFGRLEREVELLAVDLDAGVALGDEVRKQVFELAFLVADDRRDDLRAGALGEFENLVDHVLCGLLADLLARDGVVLGANAGVQEAEVVVEFGDGPDGRPRVVGPVLLVDGDGGREALDGLDLRLVHLAEEVPRVGRKRLDVPPLALRVDGVEREGGLA